MLILTKRAEKREHELNQVMAFTRITEPRLSIHNGFAVLEAFKRYERKLQRLAEHSCNGYPMEKTEYRDGKMYRYSVEDVAWKTRCEKAEARTEKAVKELAEFYGLNVDFQGDPRGLMFRLTHNGQEVQFYQNA